MRVAQDGGRGPATVEMRDDVPERGGQQPEIAGVTAIGAGARLLDENRARGEQGRVAKQRGSGQRNLGADGKQRFVAENRQSRVDGHEHEAGASHGSDDDRLERQRGLDERHSQQHRGDGLERLRRQADANRERRPAADRDILRKRQIASAFQYADRDEGREREDEERKMLRSRQADEQQIKRREQQSPAAGGQSQKDEELAPFALNGIVGAAIMREQVEPRGRAEAFHGRGKPQDDAPLGVGSFAKRR